MSQLSTFKKLRQSEMKILFIYLFLPLFILADYHSSDAYITLSKDSNDTSSNIHVSIKNTGDKNIHILKRNIDINNNIFSVRFNGQEVPYIGRIIKRKHNNNTNYITLEPEEIYSFDVILSEYYKMNKKGNYSIQYKSGKQTEIKKELYTAQIKTKKLKVLSFNFSPLSTKYTKTMRKMGNYNQCSQIEINTIMAARQKALLISEDALNAINTTAEFIKSDRYVTWFGTTTNTNAKVVKASFNNITDALKNKNIDFDCSCNDPYLAYVHADKPYKIYLCNGFWSAELEGSDSQSGTIIHQLSHFDIVASTENYSYGKEDAKKLATQYPQYTIYNADAYEYFAENTPYLTMDNIFSIAQSIFISNNTTLGDSLQNQYEKNIYKITVGESGMYSFFSSGGLDTEGTLYDENHFILKFNDDTDFDNFNFSFSEYLLEGNIYYLKVNAYENNLGNYTLNIHLNNKLDWLIPVINLIF